MLPLKNRLKKEKEFQLVFNHGRFIASDLLFIRFLDNGINEIRVGFIVSKKVSKKAVLRNRIKRVLREVIRNKMGRMKKNVDMIIVAKGKISKSEPGEIGDSLEELLKKSDLIK